MLPVWGTSSKADVNDLVMTAFAPLLETAAGIDQRYFPTNR